jgi:hypothetical protein
MVDNRAGNSPDTAIHFRKAYQDAKATRPRTGETTYSNNKGIAIHKGAG